MRPSIRTLRAAAATLLLGDARYCRFLLVAVEEAHWDHWYAIAAR
jgi:hypothetical protein